MPEPFLAFVECAGCGELFPVRSPYALKHAKWCSERCRKRQYQRPCSICGKPCGGSDKSIRCTECALDRTHAVQRGRRDEIDARIVELRAAGLRNHEIAERLQLTPTAVGNRVHRARQRGVVVRPAALGRRSA